MWIIFEIAVLTGFVLVGIAAFKRTPDEMYAEAGELRASDPTIQRRGKCETAHTASCPLLVCSPIPPDMTSHVGALQRQGYIKARSQV